MFQATPTPGSDTDISETTIADPAMGAGGVGSGASPGSAPEPIPGIDDIFDIEPPVEVPWWEPWMIYTAVPVAAVLVFIILFFLLRALVRTKRKSQFQIARDQALQNLTRLENEVAKMNGQEFGIAASDVLRTYLTRARGLRATNQTSYEFLQDLKENSRFGVEIKTFLAEFLGRCDELKFAPDSIRKEPSLELLDGASEFIRSDIRNPRQPVSAT